MGHREGRKEWVMIKFMLHKERLFVHHRDDKIRDLEDCFATFLVHNSPPLKVTYVMESCNGTFPLLKLYPAYWIATIMLSLVSIAGERGWRESDGMPYERGYLERKSWNAEYKD